MLISQTAVSHGYGRDPYKWVSGATRAEYRAAREGETVVFEDDRLSNGNSGHFLRVIVPRGGSWGGWTRRVATDAEVDEYEKLTGRQVRYVPMTIKEN